MRENMIRFGMRGIDEESPGTAFEHGPGHTGNLLRKRAGHKAPPKSQGGKT
jgi:hypothetical protein